MNAIKIGNTFSSLFLVGMMVSIGVFESRSPLNHLNEDLLNETFQNLFHINQIDKAKLSGETASIGNGPIETEKIVLDVKLASETSPTEVVDTSPQPEALVVQPAVDPAQNEVISPVQQQDGLEQEPLQSEVETLPEEQVNLSPEEVSPVNPEPEKSTIFGGPFFSQEINPLTGLVVEDQGMMDRRPAMIKVSNYPRYGRPHAGLSFADIVFEYYIGEEANRFLALFYSKDAPKIGPLRSGRLIDAQLTNLYQGVLSYGNADPKVEKVLAKELGSKAIPFSRSPCPVACGTADTHTVAGVFVNSAELSKLATRNGVAQNRPDLTGTYFDPTPPESDQYAVKIGVEYSFRDRGEWHYDPETGTYLRWIEAMGSNNTIYMTPLPDRLTGEQLRFSNVIIIFAKYIEYAPTLHDVEIWNNFDGQRAVVFRDGMMIEGSWKVEDQEHPIQFSDVSGNPLPLKPGNTWIVVAGSTSSFAQTEPGRWEMLFHLP